MQLAGYSLYEARQHGKSIALAKQEFEKQAQNAPAFHRERLKEPVRWLAKYSQRFPRFIDIVGHWFTRINTVTFLVLLILFIVGMITWDMLKEKVQAFFAILGM